MANKWRIKEALKELEIETFKQLEDYAEILKEEVNRDAPGSIPEHTGVRVNRIAKKVTVFNDHPAAAYTEFGTTGHFVAPVVKKALHWKEDDIDRFSKGHWVSGITPMGWFRKGIDRAVRKF